MVTASERGVGAAHSVPPSVSPCGGGEDDAVRPCSLRRLSRAKVGTRDVREANSATHFL